MARSDVQVRIRDLGQQLPNEVREAILRRAAAHAVGLIKARTARGVDVHGRAFAPYAKEYARLRAGTGRQVHPVNLLLTGAMLDSMTVLEVTPERALLGFQGASTPGQFRRLRTKKGTATSRKGRGQRVTHVLSRVGADRPVANALKAAALHRGTDKLPPRQFFALSPEERRKVLAEAASMLRIRR